MADVENVVQAASPVADAQPGMQPAPLELDGKGKPISAHALRTMEPSDFLAAYLRSMAAGALPPAQVRAAVEAIRATADAAERLDEVLRRASMPCTDADGNLTRGLLPTENEKVLVAASNTSLRLLAPSYCPRCDGKMLSEPAPGDAGAEGDDENHAEEPGEPAKGLMVGTNARGAMAEVENVVQAASAASPVADAQPGMQPAPLKLDEEGKPISAHALRTMDPPDFLVAYLRSMAAGALPPAQVRAAVEAIRAAADAAERLDEVFIRTSMSTDADGNRLGDTYSGVYYASSRLLVTDTYCARCRGKIVSEWPVIGAEEPGEQAKVDGRAGGSSLP